ncbi:MAG: hypothetical protein GDA36_03400 [Rhodobacteraceae bacterium]|nr:hypothetical protein [Paracoccaceae bacterium]
MIVILGGVFGAALGVYTANKRGGNRWDMAQYAAGFGVAFMLAGLLVTILIHRFIV